ncbi:MAG: DnaJ domain-containing protein [Anaerolineae bacterium]|nr:DnaJ domain-containing protein [Anaerolineae bacterium]
MTTKSVKDYYGILGVMPTATPEEIRQAYRRMARAYHPDVSTVENAEDMFLALNEAYEVLADPAKRKVYDGLTVGGASTETQPRPPVSPSEAPDTAARATTVRTTPATPQPRPVPSPVYSPTASPPRRSYPTWAIFLILVGVLIILAVGTGALLSMRQNRPTGDAAPVKVVKLATFKSTPTVPAGVSVVQEGGTPLLTVLLHQLDVAGRTFSVVPVAPELGRWPVPEQQSDMVVWIHGTVINYVIGVPYTPESESLLGGLGDTEHLTVTLDNGTALVFGAPQAKRIAADDLTPMNQQQPGLTLVILGGSQSNRLVVFARYLPEESLSVGAGQRVDGLLVEVVRSGVMEDVGDTRHFVVEYRVTNQSAATVTPSFFDLVLESGAGQRYPLNAEVTTQGEHGALQMPLEVGMTAMGSAGYLLPRDTEPPLTWVFRADATSVNAARSVLPYERPLPNPPQPTVEIASAFADGKRNTIVINGTLGNTGETALSVTLDDLSLTSNMGKSSLQASTPLLPWSIAPGARMDFEVQFSWPENVDSVLLNILGFTFQLEGLP